MKISKLLMNFFIHKSNVSVNIGNALDVLGNEVDKNGHSLDKNGDIIDLMKSFRLTEEVIEGAQSGQDHSLILAKKIVKEFYRNNRVLSSHLVAFTALRVLERKYSPPNLYGLLNLPDNELIIPYNDFKMAISKLCDALRAMKDSGNLNLADHLLSDDEDYIIRHGIEYLGAYHSRSPLGFSTKGDVQIHNTNLLYYYHNRLNGYELEKYLQ